MYLEVKYEEKTETALFCSSFSYSINSYAGVIGTFTWVKYNCYGCEKCIFSFNKIFCPTYKDRIDF